MTEKSEDAKIPDWIKDIDLGRTAENLLIGAVLFVGRFFKTHISIIYRPQLFEAEMLTLVDYKDQLRLTYVRPLVFFALTAFIAIAFSQKALGGISFVEWIFDRYPFLSNAVTIKIEEFSIGKSLALMIPLILVVSLYASVSQACFHLLGKSTAYKQQLSICAYICGSLLLAEIIASNFEMHVWGEPDSQHWIDEAIRPVIGVLGMCVGAAWGLIAIYRYFYFLKNAFCLDRWQLMLYPVTTFFSFWIFLILLVFLVDPFLGSLQ